MGVTMTRPAARPGRTTSSSFSRSRARAITPLVTKAPAQPAHHVDEAREAGLDHGGVVDAAPALARQPHHERRHGDAVIHVGRDEAAAGERGRCRARSGRRPLSTATPLCAASRRCAAMRSLSFTRSSSMPRMIVVALGEGGGDGEDRIFVDHRGRALGRHARRPSAPNGAREVGRPPRRSRRGGSRSSIARPSRRSVSKRPVRVGFSITPSRTRSSEPGTISAATIAKAAEEGSPGTRTRRGPSSAGRRA